MIKHEFQMQTDKPKRDMITQTAVQRTTEFSTQTKPATPPPKVQKPIQRTSMSQTPGLIQMDAPTQTEAKQKKPKPQVQKPILFESAMQTEKSEPSPRFKD